MKQHWDDRYRSKTYAYGESPNEFLKEQLQKLSPGTILFPAEGEGRNAVYAARMGWQVFAFDQSIQGKYKAMQLARKNKVTLDYSLDEFEKLNYQPGQFDAIALIYAHFDADKKSRYHKTLTTYLRKGGTIVLEAFSKQNLEYVRRDPKIGGPKDIDTLFSVEEIASDFADFEVQLLQEIEVELHEGEFHNGLGCVVRFVGRKK